MTDRVAVLRTEGILQRRSEDAICALGRPTRRNPADRQRGHTGQRVSGDDVRRKFGRQPSRQKPATVGEPRSSSAPVRYAPIGTAASCNPWRSTSARACEYRALTSMATVMPCHSSSLSTRWPWVAYVCGGPHTRESLFLPTTFLSALRTRSPLSARLDTLTCA